MLINLIFWLFFESLLHLHLCLLRKGVSEYFFFWGSFVGLDVCSKLVSSSWGLVTLCLLSTGVPMGGSGVLVGEKSCKVMCSSAGVLTVFSF